MIRAIIANRAIRYNDNKKQNHHKETQISLYNLKGNKIANNKPNKIRH